jgi:hypothetical protein
VKADAVGKHFRQTKQDLIDGLTKIMKGWAIFPALTGVEQDRANNLITEGTETEGTSIAQVANNRSDCLKAAETPPSS